MTTTMAVVLGALTDEALDELAVELFGRMEIELEGAAEAYRRVTEEQVLRAENEVAALRYRARKAGL